MSEEVKNSSDLIPEVDREFLNSKGFSYDVIPDGKSLLLIINNFELSPVYIPQKADLLIVIPAGYPNAQLDMFWTFPDVKLINGNWPQTADQHHQYHGRNYQRWSRHGTWRLGIDSIKSFLATIRREIDKGI